MQNKLTEEVAELVQSVIADTDFYLVDTEVKGAGTPEIWIYLDGRKRSINMDECAKISNELSFLMDAHELFNGAYRLNVSSPGLDRSLVDWRQYSKNKGRKVKVKYKNDEGNTSVKGMLKEVLENKIIIEKQQEELFEVSFEKIVETKVIPSLK